MCWFTLQMLHYYTDTTIPTWLVQPVLRDRFCCAEGTVSQDRFYCNQKRGNVMKVIYTELDSSPSYPSVMYVCKTDIYHEDWTRINEYILYFGFVIPTGKCSAGSRDTYLRCLSLDFRIFQFRKYKNRCHFSVEITFSRFLPQHLVVSLLQNTWTDRQR